MRSIAVFGVLLLLAIGIPIAVLEWQHGKRPEPGPDRDHERSTGPQGQQTDRVTPTPEVAQPQARVQRLIHLQGTYFSSNCTPEGNAELRLRTVDDLRPVWTDGAGRFSIPARPAAFPLRLATTSGQVLCEIPAALDDDLALLNLGIVHPRRQYDDLIAPSATSYQREESADICVLRIYGKTRLPEGTDIVVRLLGGGNKIVQETLYTLDGSDLIGQLECPTYNRYAGWYRLQLAWRWGTDPAAPELLERFQSLLPKQVPGELPDWLTVPVFVGKPEDEVVQEEQIVAFFDAALATCIESRDLLLWLGAVFRSEELDSEIAALVPQLKKHPLLQPIRHRTVSGKKFPIKLWRRLIDQDLPEAWRPYVTSDNVPFAEKYPKRRQNLAAAYMQLHRLAHLESRLIYRHYKQPADPGDYLDCDFGPETERALSRQRLEEHLRRLKQ